MTPTAASAWPTRVHATYKVTFGIFDVGTFEFNSSVAGPSYTLTSNARLAGLGFEWTGVSRAAGAVAGDAPAPAGYAFDFRTASKAGSVKFAFAEKSVQPSSISVQPPAPRAPGTVPVREVHLKDVLDPLSAVMALTRARTSNPCNRRLSIFDGKQRFDLQFTFVRQQRIAEQRPSGQPGIGYVCRVRFIPVAGHKLNEETRQLSANTGIEVILRPVPSANLLVPYQITIPLPLGSAVMTSQRVDITTPSHRQIALVH